MHRCSRSLAKASFAASLKDNRFGQSDLTPETMGLSGHRTPHRPTVTHDFRNRGLSRCPFSSTDRMTKQTWPERFRSRYSTATSAF